MLIKFNVIAYIKLILLNATFRIINDYMDAISAKIISAATLSRPYFVAVAIFINK